MFFSVLLENSILYNVLEASRFSSDLFIQVSIKARAFRKSKLVNVYSIAFSLVWIRIILCGLLLKTVDIHLVLLWT